jgi:hypothetical protein
MHYFKLDRKLATLTLMLAWFGIIKPPTAIAAPACEELVITFQHCLNVECPNYPNIGGYCASAPSVTTQSECYAYAWQYWSHWSGQCRPECNPAGDPPDLCAP